jgi:hypothetical protein
MRKTRAHAIWDDAMFLLGHERLGEHYRTGFSGPRSLYQTMKRMWVRDRRGYLGAMAAARAPAKDAA